MIQHPTNQPVVEVHIRVLFSAPYDPTPHQPTSSRGTYQSTSSPYDPTPHQPTSGRGTHQSTSSPYDPTPHQPTNSRGTYQSTSSPYDPTPHQPTNSRGTHQNTISLHNIIQHPTNQPIVEVCISLLRFGMSFFCLCVWSVWLILCQIHLCTDT